MDHLPKGKMDSCPKWKSVYGGMASGSVCVLLPPSSKAPCALLVLCRSLRVLLLGEGSHAGWTLGPDHHRHLAEHTGKNGAERELKGWRCNSLEWTLAMDSGAKDGPLQRPSRVPAMWHVLQNWKMDIQRPSCHCSHHLAKEGLLNFVYLEV